MKRLICLFAAVLFFTIPTFAQLDGNPQNWCRNGAFPQESAEFRMAKITGKKGERVYFYDDALEDCPNNKKCRLKSYLIPNDEVIVSRTYGNWACSWYQPKKGSETVGWIAVAKLEFIETKTHVATTDWLGDWRHYDNQISIGKGNESGVLSIKGDAIWKGLGDNVHIGELDYEAKPQGNVMKINEDSTDEYECKVTMRMVGRFLVVSDNLNCGGMNVSFSGVYQRK